MMPMAPPIRRTPMAPRRFAAGAASPRAPWDAAAYRRRTALFLLIAAQTAIGAWFMADALPYNGRQPLEAARIPTKESHQ